MPCQIAGHQPPHHKREPIVLLSISSHFHSKSGSSAKGQGAQSQTFHATPAKHRCLPQRDTRSRYSSSSSSPLPSLSMSSSSTSSTLRVSPEIFSVALNGNLPGRL